MGIFVLVPAEVIINSPAKALTISELAYKTELLCGTGQPGFESGAAIITGITMGQVLK